LDNVFEFLKNKCNALDIINKQEIIEELTTKFNIRINDMEPTELEGSRKDLEISNKGKTVNNLKPTNSLRDNPKYLD